MSINTRVKIFVQRAVLGWVVLWPSVAMSVGEGQESERLAEAYSRPAEKNSHQSKSLLFQGALEELKKNPAAADMKACKTTTPKVGEVCIRTYKKV